MTRTVAVVMDPLASLAPAKDTTLALIEAMFRRQWNVSVLQVGDLLWQEGQTLLRARSLRPTGKIACADDLQAERVDPCTAFDAIIMRKDPPVTMDYIYATYLLDNAAREGTVVVNDPSSIRDANEKLFTTWFPQCMPPTLISCQRDCILSFVQKHQHTIIKPLHGMGGHCIFQLRADDPNCAVIIDTVTAGGRSLVMVQTFIKEIMDSGDKRIIMIDGEPAPYALARLPAAGDFRGNLAAGASSQGVALTTRDRWLCQQVGPTLKQRGLWLVGLDVIGDFITEINVTSPTCIRELEQQHQLTLADDCIDQLEKKMK